MYRAAVRSVSRGALGGRPGAFVRSAPRRLASTARPVDKPRSWKSSTLRWAIAAAAVYYYNTSSVFADEASEHPAIVPPPSPSAESDLRTVDAVIEEKRKQMQAKPAESSDRKSNPVTQEAAQKPTPEARNTIAQDGSEDEDDGPDGAFNPETGEINWDCPCLGGMAHGPCGEEFRAAFSCFVYSDKEPKGIDCVENFQKMQDCFRKHPDIYGAELADDDEPQGGNEAGASQPPAGVPEAPREPRDQNPEAGTKEKKQEAYRDQAVSKNSEREVPKESKSQSPSESVPRDGEQKPSPELRARASKSSAPTDNKNDVPGNKRVNHSAPNKWEDATDANDKEE
ncbi:hypothetical protein CDD83_1910 [Cordyceps sp. RAO-2017]|nr:hypothetical protein CDD83_1910 [Cordyceps sp. RAO-2017]